MNGKQLRSIVLSAGLAACGSPQAATPDPTAEAPSTAAPTSEPMATSTPDSAVSASATAVAHAPGGPHCNDLAKACHEVGHSAGEAGKCHEIGHTGDAAACEKEHARCLDVCKKATEKGGHDHSKGHHAP